MKAQDAKLLFLIAREKNTYLIHPHESCHMFLKKKRVMSHTLLIAAGSEVGKKKKDVLLLVRKKEKNNKIELKRKVFFSLV
jgi:hypothetical protein